MVKRKQKRTPFKVRVAQISTFLLSAIFLVGVYFFGSGAIQNLVPELRDASTITKEDDEATYVKNHFNQSKMYHPPTPIPALPSQELAPVIGRVEMSERVVFLTIDDGLYKQKRALEVMQNNGLSATLFLNDNAIKDDYEYFALWRRLGSTVQNHTLSHPHLGGMSYDDQRLEICPNGETLTAKYGVKPTLFRAPYGENDDNTRKVVTDCGMKAIVWWSVVVEKGKIYYQNNATQLQPGDIILLHFTEELDKDLAVILKQIASQGFQVGQLEDWLH